MTREFTLTEELDKRSEIFQQDVHNDELLDQFARGQLSGLNLLDRLEYLKVMATRAAGDALQQDADAMAEDHRAAPYESDPPGAA
jgi:hypothetical protein